MSVSEYKQKAFLRKWNVLLVWTKFAVGSTRKLQIASIETDTPAVLYIACVIDAHLINITEILNRSYTLIVVAKICQEMTHSLNITLLRSAHVDRLLPTEWVPSVEFNAIFHSIQNPINQSCLCCYLTDNVSTTFASHHSATYLSTRAAHF